MNIDNLNDFPRSYWIASTEETSYPPLEKDIDVDLAIIGGGMVGISCAYELCKEGMNIAIIEADRIISATTAHTTAKITSQHGLIYYKLKNSMGDNLANQYAKANENAIREIKKIIDTNKIDCDYTSQPAFIYTQKDENLKKIEDEVNTASSLGIKASFVKEIPFSIPIKGAVRFDNQSQFHPRKYLLALANIIQNSGVQIYEQTRAVEIENGVMDSYIINTAKGNKVKAKKVIIASHYPFFNKEGMYFTRIYTERSYIVAIKAEEKFPGGMYLNAEEPTRSLRSHPTENGELILVVGENHKTGQGENTNNHYKALINFSNEIFTVEDIPYRWSTQDCMTMDGIPFIGNYTSETPNLYVATGFGKWGMTNSIVSSLILKDLIINGSSPCQEVYNPSRKTIIPSAKNFIVENINVAGQLIGGKLSKLSTNVNLNPDEGDVFEIDGKRTGAYKDKQGEMHLVNTTCTHMGCEVQWNEAERSWDCPCHGSRFGIDGGVIEGPAVSELSFDNDVNTIKKLISEDY